MEKEKLVRQFASESFRSGLNCAESVYNALLKAGVIDIAPETRKMCTGFGGGIAGNRYTCGALSVAIMALGLKYGRFTSVDTNVKEEGKKNYDIFTEVLKEFEKQNGAIMCKDILELQKQGSERRTCIDIVEDLSELVVKYFQK